LRSLRSFAAIMIFGDETEARSFSEMLYKRIVC
jgi:hypothetical protein